ncbi:hypothetical protein [Parvibaculum sp.]|uniref:hypothetical protein n=1 Tax=Parvibaculum sp. TaxID=2024848 RepID=UPI002BA60EAB|nr:hypothetical protein [Parvibaculum sp.]HUD53518.1 hypothetical protein [Parvibaculum sp.]
MQERDIHPYAPVQSTKDKGLRPLDEADDLPRPVDVFWETLATLTVVFVVIIVVRTALTIFHAS